MENREPSRRALYCISLAVIALTYLFHNYIDYRVADRMWPGQLEGYLAGHEPAPFQYRIGPYWCGHVIARLTHTKMKHGMGIFDGFCLLPALFLLSVYMDRRATQAGLDAVERAASGFSMLVLCGIYLAWANWYPAITTCPTILYLALCLLLLSDVIVSTPLFRAGLLLGLAVLQSFVRADTVAVFFLGQLAALIFSSKQAVFGRVQAAVTGVCGISIALALQWYLARVVYPNARYDTDPVQLLANIKELPIDVTFFLFMPACLFTLWILWRARKELSVVERGVVAYALLYFPAWLTFARLNEVRVFTPTAIVLAPVASVFIGRQVFRSPFPVGIRREEVGAG